MERPEFLNTVTIGDTRRKYRENQKSLDNMMLLVSSGIIQELIGMSRRKHTKKPLKNLQRKRFFNG